MRLLDAKVIHERLAEIADHLTVLDKLQKTPAIVIDGVPATTILMRRLLLIQHNARMVESAAAKGVKVLNGYGILSSGSDMPEV